MKFTIVTGLSGAGKSSIVNVLEDIGYYVVDNIPPRLISEFVNICIQANNQGQMDKVAIVADVRAVLMQGEDMMTLLKTAIDDIKRLGHEVTVVFLDADNATLVKRYKETRRVHPLEKKTNGSLLKALEMEHEMFAPMIELADLYMDTSQMPISEFKNDVKRVFSDDPDNLINVKILSFGFKYGLPLESDLVFDVRCLPNPFYIDELKHLTGLDKKVRDYVMGFEQSKELEKKITDLVDFLMPMYIEEGKSSITIAFGCTGGKHRSVTFAENMYAHLKDSGVSVTLTHREIK
ncbi:MAG: RNase adapter RapZ [Oscillospiraceae bacterium]|nr:RNase adapter RapZ [Oscillospiraceae bacterium]